MYRLSRYLSFVIAAALVTPVILVDGTASQGVDRTRLDVAVDAIVAEAMGPDGGLSLALAVGPDLVVARGWGTIDRGRRKATVDSVFPAGSLMGQFLTVGVLQLVDQERVALDDEIRKYVPELELGEEQVTVAQVLAHTSGLFAYTGAPGEHSAGSALEIGDVLAQLEGLPLDTAPGYCFTHTNTNFFLLGLILQRVTKKEIPALLEERFFGPLDLSSTSFCFDSPLLGDDACVYQEIGAELVDDHRALQPFAADRLCSTARDLVRWQRALVEGRALGAETTALLTEPQLCTDGSISRTGLGVSLTTLDEHRGVSYGGAVAGCRAHVGYYPEFDLTIAILTDDEDVEVRRLERDLARVVFDLPPAPAVRDLPLDPEAFAFYVGSYYIGCTRYLVKQAGTRLVAMPPDFEDFVLLYQGDHVFVSDEDPDVRLTFLSDDDNDRAISFVLDEHGVEAVAKRMDSSRPPVRRSKGGAR